jgi:hypothetical protein
MRHSVKNRKKSAYDNAAPFWLAARLLRGRIAGEAAFASHLPNVAEKRGLNKI